MKKLFYLFLMAPFVVGCKNSTKESVSEADTSKVDISKVFESAVGKVPNKNKIPKYKTMSAQGATVKLPQLVVTTPPACSSPIPTTIKDLNSGAELSIYKFDSDQNASASLFGFGGNIAKNELLFIEDYVRYKTVQCDTSQRKYGVGLRCYIYVKSIKGKLSYSKLSVIAASVELGKAEASFSLKSIGFAMDGSVLSDGLPTQGDYDVQNFGKLAVLFNNVLKTLNSNSTIQFSPVQLPE